VCSSSSNMLLLRERVADGEVDEFFALTDYEAEKFYAPNFVQMKDGKYHASLSVLHGLHCLNAVRLHIDKEWYDTHGGVHQDGLGYPPNWTRTHMCKLNPPF